MAGHHSVFISSRSRRSWPATLARLVALTAAVLGSGTVLAGASPEPSPPVGAGELTSLAAPVNGHHRQRPDPRFPSAESVAAARRFAKQRSGTVSFALIDDRGRMHGHDAELEYPSASISKAMLLVAYLAQLHEAGTALDDEDRALLDPMIRYSDNAAASQVQALLAPGALEDVADQAGMTNFDYYGDWANATVTAADQARFFLRAERLTPPPHRDYVRELLTGVISEHAWGIPAAAPDRWPVLFKGGWRPTDAGELAHQAALVKRPSGAVAIAVLSDDNPTHDYGTETVRGIAERLLTERRPPPAGAGAAGRL